MKAVLRTATAGALVPALMIGLAACGSGSNNPASGQQYANGKTFTMILSADPGNLDPHFTTLSVTLQADRFLYDSLVNVDPSGNLVAGLADKWEATTTKAVFTLRKGITCSDGSPLTATQVAQNISFVGDPKNASARIGVWVPVGATATGDDAAGTVTVGESGSGKSTLARAAVGLIPLAGGRILLDGQPLPKRPPLQMVFQDPYSSLDPRFTIGASIAEAIPRGAFPRSEIGAEVARMLEIVGLPADPAARYQARYPGQLSGGQRQRVALARALAGRPAVLIADEITSALDVSIQGTVLNLVRQVQARMRLTMLFISHNLAVVRYVSDTIAVMQGGRIVESGPTGELLRDPQHPYTRQLLEAARHTTRRSR